MFKLEKFAEIVLPNQAPDPTLQLKESIDKLNDQVSDLQSELSKIKPSEAPSDPVPAEGSGPSGAPSET